MADSREFPGIPGGPGVHKRSIIDLLQNWIRIYKFAAALRGSPRDSKALLSINRLHYLANVTRLFLVLLLWSEQ